MRANIILICISLVLVAVCTVSVFMMRDTALELMNIAQQAADALPQDMPAAARHLDSFSSIWAATQNRWQLIAIHHDLEQVSLALMEAQYALEAQDAAEAVTACARLTLAVECILQKEIPTIGNIF